MDGDGGIGIFPFNFGTSLMTFQSVEVLSEYKPAVQSLAQPLRLQPRTISWSLVISGDPAIFYTFLLNDNTREKSFAVVAYSIRPILRQTA